MPKIGFHFDFFHSEGLKSNALNFIAFSLDLFAIYFEYTGVFSFFERFELKLDFMVSFGLDNLTVLKFKIIVGRKFALDFDGSLETVGNLKSCECGFVDLCAESFDYLFGWLFGFEC